MRSYTPERNFATRDEDEEDEDDDTEGGVVERISIARDAERCHVTRRVKRTDTKARIKERKTSVMNN